MAAWDCSKPDGPISKIVLYNEEINDDDMDDICDTIRNNT